jgi:hypothetical protein
LYVLLHEDNKNLTRVRTVSDFIFSEVQRNRPAFFSEMESCPSEHDGAVYTIGTSSPVGPS